MRHNENLRVNADSSVAPGVEPRPDRPHTRLLTVNDACGQLRLSRRKVDLLIAEGRLRAVKVDRSKRIRLEDLEDFIDSLPDA